MLIETVQAAFYERHESVLQKPAAGHPLVVIPASVEIRSIELRVRKSALKPTEGTLVTGVHSQGDLGLLTVPAEVPFANKKANDVAFIEWIQSRMFHGKHDGETIHGPPVLARIGVQN